VALRRPEHPERVAVVAVVLLVVVNLAIFGTKKEVRGIPSKERPAAILGLTPQEDDHIIPQQGIVVDLRLSYTGQLSIDRRLIPQDQLEITKPNLLELSFTLGPTHDIRQFSPGVHNATIEYWPLPKTNEEAKAGGLLGTYTWVFNVG